MPIALEARDLVKEYPGVTAVDGVSFSVPEGICFGLLGPNGAGKTTTVEIIEGVTRSTSGQVYYYGEIAGAKFRQEAGIQFQNTALQDYLTVRETIEMFRSLYERQADLDEIIEQCSLADLLDRDNRKLSGGQRQRLLLAVALVNRPRLIFWTSRRPASIRKRAGTSGTSSRTFAPEVPRLSLPRITWTKHRSSAMTSRSWTRARSSARERPTSFFSKNTATS